MLKTKHSAIYVIKSVFRFESMRCGDSVKDCRTYGNRPFNVAVVHGGPGAAGEMAPVAREISLYNGVIEPLQTAASLDGQVQELLSILEDNAEFPVIPAGWSWGTMLSFIFTSRYPGLVKKLILIGSGVYEQDYSAKIMETRLSRLNEGERSDALSLMGKLGDTDVKDKDALLAGFGLIIGRADFYDPLPDDSDGIGFSYEIYRKVWEEAEELRRSGKLLDMGREIKCPVVAIHGDYDPHPYEGVRNPLSRVLKDFRPILLEKCGHKPWIERQAKERFYSLLKDEIGM